MTHPLIEVGSARIIVDLREITTQKHASFILNVAKQAFQDEEPKEILIKTTEHNKARDKFLAGFNAKRTINNCYIIRM